MHWYYPNISLTQAWVIQGTHSSSDRNMCMHLTHSDCYSPCALLLQLHICPGQQLDLWNGGYTSRCDHRAGHQGNLLKPTIFSSIKPVPQATGEHKWLLDYFLVLHFQRYLCKCLLPLTIWERRFWGSSLHITGLAEQASICTQDCFSVLFAHVSVTLAWVQSPESEYLCFTLLWFLWLL